MITTHTITEDERKRMLALIDGVYRIISFLNKETIGKEEINKETNNATIKVVTEIVNENIAGIKKILYIE